MQKLLIKVALGVWFVLQAGAYAQQTAKEQRGAGDLAQYIRDARKAGTSEQQIRINAANAGWPADLVSAAMDAPRDSSAARFDMNRPGAIENGKSKGTPAAAPAPPAGSVPASASAAQPAEPKAAPAAATGNTAAPEPSKAPAVINRGVPDDYQIGAGDELQISVWKEPDASVPAVVVRPDGRISMPMLKEVSVAGLTPTDAEKMITEQLVNFISSADVTVIVKAINSKKIYVVGGVKKEGPIPYTYRMTILQALSEAGGLSDYAKKKKIYVLRHENGRNYKLPFDYDAALRGEKMELNVPLLPGDTLVIPK